MDQDIVIIMQLYIQYGLGFNPHEMIEETWLELFDIDIKSPGEIIIKEISNERRSSPKYPSVHLYPNSKLYPQRKRYKYIILKYGIYEQGYNMGAFYYQAIEIRKNYGLNNLKIKYERG